MMCTWLTSPKRKSGKNSLTSLPLYSGGSKSARGVTSLPPELLAVNENHTANQRSIRKNHSLHLAILCSPAGILELVSSAVQRELRSTAGARRYGGSPALRRQPDVTAAARRLRVRITHLEPPVGVRGRAEGP